MNISHTAEVLTLYAELGCSVSQLALAWVAAKTTTSTIILGASRPEQILDNLKSLDLIPKLTPSILEKIEIILGNKPADRVSIPLDPPMYDLRVHCAKANIWKASIGGISS